MNQKPLISVVMPVYNGGVYLKEAIESILNQTYKNFEFIIIDDGSTDNSLSIIKEYAFNDNRIIVVDRENRGLITTLNEGIDLAKGKYIARMDADDISLPTRFEKQFKYMEQNNLDICGGDFIIIDEKGKEIKHSVVPKSFKEIVLTLGFNVPFAHPSVFIKKSFLIKHKIKYGGSGKKFAEDLDMWLTMFNHGAIFGNVNDKILLYRIVPTSLSRINSKMINKEIEIQFNNFVNKQHNVYKQCIYDIVEVKSLTKEQQILLIRSIFALKSNFNLKLLFKALQKVNFINLNFVILSEIKKWIKSR